MLLPRQFCHIRETVKLLQQKTPIVGHLAFTKSINFKIIVIIYQFVWHNSKEPHTYKTTSQKLPRRFDACGAILSKDFSPHSTKFHFLIGRKHKSRDPNAARSAVHCDLLMVANGTNTEKRKGLKMHKELSKALVPNLTSNVSRSKKICCRSNNPIQTPKR